MRDQKYRYLTTKTALLTTVLVSFCSIFGSNLAQAALEKNTISVAITAEPPNLDASKATDTTSFMVLGHVMEGLARYDQTGKIVPGVAEKWEINDKGATFHLRKNAKWHDGKPVTAHDFVFSWSTAVDPKNASEYAFILYPIKNAEAINTKKAAAGTKLGVEAPDDYTLKITFEKPCGYFLALTTFGTYFPMRKDVHDKFGEKYAADADKMAYNGAFMLTKWVHGASLRMEKNPNYHRKNEIKLDAIEVPYITNDETAIFNLFKDGKTNMIEKLNKETLINAQKEKMQLKRFAEGTLFFYRFNFRDGRVTANKNVRKALSVIFNPEEYVSRVVGVPGTLPGQGLIPSWMMGKKQLFRKEFPLPPAKQDIAAAKQALDAGLKELGLKQLPALTWLTNDTPLVIAEAEYMQNLAKKTLGVDLKIDKQIFKQRLAKARAGDFDIESAGWGPDYNDPMTYADLFTSWNENNNGLYKNPAVDELIRKAQGTTDAAIRLKAMADAEKILFEDHVLVPLYERTIVFTNAKNITGIVRRSVGYDPDYTNARMVGSGSN